MTATTIQPCSCGREDDHIVSRARTFDGVTVVRWHSGLITGLMGLYPPRTSRPRWLSRAARVSALVWQDISLYEWAELAKLFRAGRMALEQTSWPPLVAMRRLMAGETTRALKAGRTVRTVKREHHHTCPCRQCGGRNLPPGWIAGPVRYR